MKYILFASLALVVFTACLGHAELPVTRQLTASTPEANSLLQMVQQGDLNGINSLLEKSPDLIHATNAEGYTALHLAARPGSDGVLRLKVDYSRIVEFLLEHGADVNAVNEAGETPLHMVTSYVVPPHPEKHKHRVMPVGSVGGLPYEIVFPERQMRSLRAILRHKPPINAASENGLTPLHLAAFRGHADMVKQLLESGANDKAVTKNGMTPLALARLGKHDDVVSLLSSR